MSSFRADCLKGKVCFVTGGGSGICKGITEVLMKHGCDSVIMSRKMDVLEKAAKDLEAKTGRSCLAVSADVRDPESVGKAVDAALARFGRIDILVNGAAGNFLCPLDKLSYKGFKTVMEIDAHGTFIVSQAVFAKAFKSNPAGGVIVNISATLHYQGCLMQTHAGAAKAAVDAMTKHMAVEWGPYNVRVVGIAPGPIAGTEGMSRLNPFNNQGEDKKDKKAPAAAEKSPDDLMTMYVPLQRMGTPEEIGFCTLFFALPEAGYITGTTITVDGGQNLTTGNFTLLHPLVHSQWVNAPKTARKEKTGPVVSKL